MAIAIHHGPNGSFKSSGAIQDYFIPAAEQGRVVVTNILGVSRENTFKHMPKIPDSFDVIYINTDSVEGRESIARWFHWVPVGALLLFDEAGVVFPKSWNQKMIDSLNYPGGVDQAEIDGRPPNWEIAWQKQRHWNWDIVLTAPHIKFIRDDIRLTCESAFKHRNKALFGPMFKGYKEGQHDGQRDGKSYTDFESIKDKRIKPLTFELYASTKTGKFTDTFNGFNIFASPRVILLLGVTFGAVYFSLESGGLSLVPERKAPVSQSPEGGTKVPNLPVQSSVEVSVPSIQEKPIVPEKVASLALYESLSKTFDSNSDHVVDSVFNSAGRIDRGPLTGSLIYISGSAKSSSGYIYTLRFVSKSKQTTYLSTDLLNIGYTVIGKDHCSAIVEHNKSKTQITCILLST